MVQWTLSSGRVDSPLLPSTIHRLLSCPVAQLLLLVLLRQVLLVVYLTLVMHEVALVLDEVHHRQRESQSLVMAVVSVLAIGILPILLWIPSLVLYLVSVHELVVASLEPLA